MTAIIAIIASCAIAVAGALWYLATQLATLATRLAVIGEHLTELRVELHETRSSQQQYAAAIADQVHSQDTRLALLEANALGRRSKS